MPDAGEQDERAAPLRADRGKAASSRRTPKRHARLRRARAQQAAPLRRNEKQIPYLRQAGSSHGSSE